MVLRKKTENNDQPGAEVTATPPGAVITPGGQAPTASPETSNPAATEPPQSNPEANDPGPSGLAPTGGFFHSDDEASSTPVTVGEPINWTASEFIAHQKSAGWYFLLAVGAIILAALVYLLTKDKISTIVVLVGSSAFGFYAARQPRQIQYRLDDTGIGIEQKTFPYSEFRSFSVVPEGAFSSIVFLPMKRFAPLTTIYYAPDDEDRIVKLLSNILPFEEYKHDLVDQFLKHIRF